MLLPQWNLWGGGGGDKILSNELNYSTYNWSHLLSVKQTIDVANYHSHIMSGPLPPSESLIFYFSLPTVFPHELGPQEPVQSVQIPASSAVELGSEGHDTNS